jgi:acetyl esterase/lipase
MRHRPLSVLALLCAAALALAINASAQNRPSAGPPSDIRDLTNRLNPGTGANDPARDQPLWPDGAPGATGKDPADVPTIAVHLPQGAASGNPVPAIVVCPGGGYGFLANHEGEPVAKWLNTVGVAGVVLRYRHAPKYHHPAPLQDAQRAIRTVRAHAKEWKIDPNKVGILGFSAGGHLAATASTQFDAGKPEAADPIDRLNSRPDVSILVYPVITFANDKKHAGSEKNLLGDQDTPEMAQKMSAERNVTKQTPPTFLFHTMEDKAVPVENSIDYALALRKAGVPFELHVFERGAHGVGLAQRDPALKAWPDLCAAWLRARGFAGAKTTSIPVQ